MSAGAGSNVSKANVYGVLSPPAGLNVSKLVLYAVLTTAVASTATQQPQMFIVT